MVKLKNLCERNIEYIFAFLFLIICIIKFNYYFAGKELGGWDTTGHFQLAKVYATGFRDFRSLVWDEGWFCGFPAFYFYPPFFYFIVTIFYISLPIEFVTAFGFAIFFIILLLAYALNRFVLVFLNQNIPKYSRLLLSYSCIFFYFSYSGSGLQGTSLIGMWEGTFISNLGHALLLLSLSDLEMYRRTLRNKFLIKFILISSILICTHFLSAFFWLVAIFIYFLVFYKFLLKKFLTVFASFILILLISLPAWINFILFKSYTHGVFLEATYPPLLSILGKDVYEIAINGFSNGESFYINFISHLIISGRIISVLAILSYILAIRRYIHHISSRSYVLILSLVSLWLAVDNSFGYLFPGLTIHNYRAFDTFFICFSTIVTIGFFHITLILRKKLNPTYVYLIIFLFSFKNFIFLEYYAQESGRSPYFEENFPKDLRINFSIIENELKKLPKGALVFPEITRSRQFFSTPHFWSNYLRKYQLRNALGLTVESSLFPLLMFNWEYAGLKDSFRWGTEIEWSNLFFEGIENGNFETQLPSFFERSGIQYIIGHTEAFRTFVHSRPNSFTIVRDSSPFLLAEVRKTRNHNPLPAGFVSDSWMRKKERLAPSKFLRESNTVISRLQSENIQMRIINLENDLDVVDDSLREKFSLIYLYVNTGYIEEAYGIAKIFNSLGLPVILLRAPAPKNNPMILDWNPQINDLISKRLAEYQDTHHKWNFKSTSYFPELIDKNANQLFQSDTNQIATYDSKEKLELSLPKFNAVMLTILFFLLPTSYLVVSLMRKTR